jgi:hypothetical protein
MRPALDQRAHLHCQVRYIGEIKFQPVEILEKQESSSLLGVVQLGCESGSFRRSSSCVVKPFGHFVVKVRPYIGG